MKSSSCFLVVAVDLARLRPSFKNTEKCCKKDTFFIFPCLLENFVDTFPKQLLHCYHLNENERF